MIKRILLLYLLFAVSAAAAWAQNDIDKIVAVVNDEVITQSDINNMLLPIYKEYKDLYTEQEIDDKMVEESRKILKQLIEDRLLLSEAKKRDIAVDDQKVNQQLNKIKSAFSSEEDFLRSLKEQNISIKELKDIYRRNIMVSKLVDMEVRNKIHVTPVEIANYYNYHIDKFKEPSKIRLYHILIKDTPGSDEAKEKAQQVVQKLKLGADFEQMARVYSEGPNGEDGGDMGYVEKGQMLPEIDKVIFGMKESEISDPVKTDIGYHILMVKDITPPREKQLEEVSDMIGEIIFRKKFNQKLDEFLNRLRENAYISIK